MLLGNRYEFKLKIDSKMSEINGLVILANYSHFKIFFNLDKNIKITHLSLFKLNFIKIQAYKNEN